MDGEVVRFEYPEVVANHYKYKRAVYKQNSLRHDYMNKYKIIVDSAWGTKWLPI